MTWNKSHFTWSEIPKLNKLYQNLCSRLAVPFFVSCTPNMSVNKLQSSSAFLISFLKIWSIFLNIFNHILFHSKTSDSIVLPEVKMYVWMNLEYHILYFWYLCINKLESTRIFVWYILLWLYTLILWIIKHITLFFHFVSKLRTRGYVFSPIMPTAFGGVMM